MSHESGLDALLSGILQTVNEAVEAVEKLAEEKNSSADDTLAAEEFAEEDYEEAEDSSTAEELDYDTFDLESNHTSLTKAIHRKLASCPRTAYCALSPYFDGFDFNIRSQSVAARDGALRKAHNEANAYFQPDSPTGVCQEALDAYLPRIERTFIPIIDILGEYCSKNHKSSPYERLYELVYKSKENLMQEFRKELLASQDFYEMMRLDYYIDLAPIEKVDYGDSDDGISGLFGSLLNLDCEYDCPNINEVIEEMSQDATKKMNYFYQSAYKIYVNYIEQIEYFLDSLSKDMPPLQEGEDLFHYIKKQCM